MANIRVTGSVMGNVLQSILQAQDIEPGDAPSYQLCKELYLYHPLGAKMTEGPIEMAQEQSRTITIPDSPEDDVKDAFEKEWKRLGADGLIFATATLSRIYGISSIGAMIEGLPADKPLPVSKLYDTNLSFNVFDPLNTAGSLVLNQNPNAFDFMKPTVVRVGSDNFHPSRARVILNEQPIYIAYTQSAFGFVGRSVFQRALFPMKSFLQTMLTDDLITLKAGVLVSKAKQPGSVIDNLMVRVFGAKRQLIKDAMVGNVLSIGPDDVIETLNFQNLEGPYGLARTNVLKNIATAAKMPAKLLENETMVGGMAEGTEDARSISRYIKGVRKWLESLYDYFDMIVMCRAWTPAFYASIQSKYPAYRNTTFEQAFYQWKNSFTAVWPEYLEEPDSEKTKVDETRLKAIVSLVEALMPELDPENKAILIQWAADNFNELKLLFANPLQIDYEALASYEPPALTGGGEGEEPKPSYKLDSADGAKHLLLKAVTNSGRRRVG